MRAVLLSIRPKWCRKIADGAKSIEVRKTRPKFQTPFKCYIYCTAGDLQYETQNGMFLRRSGGREVIGEFICDKIYEIAPRWNEYIVMGEKKGATDEIARESCLSFDDMKAYLGEKTGYGWHISDLEIYDTPRELSSFRRKCKNDWWCESCAMYSEHRETCGNAALQINRPPQSWCYIDEANSREN